MKKFTLAITSLLAAAATSWSVPFLQLDIAGGTYNGSTETIVASDNPFSLYALVNTESQSYQAGATYYLSIAIVPSTSAGDGPFGTFTVNGVTYDTSNMHYGTPPFEVMLDSQNLPSHGIYDTHYLEIALTGAFDGTSGAYDAQSSPGGLNPGTDLGYYELEIDITDLDPDYALHFDLYTTKEVTKKGVTTTEVDQFAPFSHDAESCCDNQVPDGGSAMLLLGMGLVGLEGLRRRMKR